MNSYDKLLDKYNLKIKIDEFNKSLTLPPLPVSPIETDKEFDILYNETILACKDTIKQLKHMYYILKHS